MRLTKYLLLILLCGCATPSSPLIFARGTTIQEICFQDKPITSSFKNTDAASLLRDIRNIYGTKKSRILKQKDFIAASDRLLSLVGEGDLIDCKRALAAKSGQPFLINIQENTENNFSSNETPRISLNPGRSVESLIPTYAHELVHACQRKRGSDFNSRTDALKKTATLSEYWAYLKERNPEEKIPSDIKPDLSKKMQQLLEIEADVRRNAFIAELEAFIRMRKVYLKLIELDQSYCKETLEKPGDNKYLARIYVSGDDSWDKGHFAQNIIYWYAKDYRGRFDSNGLFRKESTSLTYQVTHADEEADRGKTFKMPRLHPRFLKELEKLEIPVKEP